MVTDSVRLRLHSLFACCGMLARAGSTHNVACLRRGLVRVRLARSTACFRMTVVKRAGLGLAVQLRFLSGSLGSAAGRLLQ